MKKYSYDYPRPALSVDCVLFGLDASAPSVLKVLFIERGQPPFEGKWALPGGFVTPGESVDAAARRELQEETGLESVFLEQLYTFGAPDRDPREHVVSVAYFGLININEHSVEAATDARRVGWFSVSDLPPGLAFDHAEILEVARTRLRGKVRYEPVVFELLPKKFTLTQLQRVYEAILERPLDKRNFRKKLMSLGVLLDLGEMQKDVSHRAARLYRFNERAYRRMERDGSLNFEIR